jgi:hypothetical protein
MEPPDEPPDRPPGEEAEETGENTLSVADIAESPREGDWLVLPALEVPGGASRVGALVEGSAEGTLPAIEAQFLAGGAPAGDWTALAPTWSEAGFEVRVADLGSVGTTVRLRVHVAALDAVRFLRWTAVLPGTPEDAGGDDHGSTSAPLREDLAGLGIVTREEWGATRSSCSSNPTKNRTTIHHTETPSEDAARQVRAIQHYHMDTRGWCDIGYHFLIGVDGTIYEGRPLDRLGAHVAGQNTGNIGISFVGCFHPGCAWGPTSPPETMIRSAGRLVRALADIYGFAVTSATVRGHRDQPGASTDCPGDNLYARIGDIIAAARSGSTTPDAGAADADADDAGSPAEADAEAGTDGSDTTGPPPETPDCRPLDCALCEATTGCGWCAFRGGCGADGDACTWTGRVGTAACWDALWPCATAACWNPTATIPACGATTVEEDFSSGAYSVHRFWTTLPAGGPLAVRLERTGGTFAPALLVADRAGRLAYGGEAAGLHPDIAVTAAVSGRDGAAADVTLEASRDIDVYLYVTGWAILDGAFRGSLPTSSRYRLSATQTCGTTPPPETPDCAVLACGICEGTAECDWCASRAVCAGAADACAWRGRVGDAACWDTFSACSVATCWNPTETIPSCGTTSWTEDFSSGRYGVHRYSTALPAGGPVTIRLDRTGGSFSPALLVSDRTGRVAFGGEVAALHPEIAVSAATSGRTGAAAEVTLEASSGIDVYLYVTGWAVVDGGFRGTLPTDSRYRMSATQACGPPPAGDPYAGLTRDGSEIPRAGLYNAALSFLGTTTEPYGDVVADAGGREWVRGGASWFGGPGDTGVGASETGAITGEVLRDLNDPLHPDAATLASRPADYYYVAMRWSYSPNGRTWWRDARILVRNPGSGVAVVVRPVDWGPNTSTRRIIDLSPQALDDLGLETDDRVDVAFALPGSALGVVR